MNLIALAQPVRRRRAVAYATAVLVTLCGTGINALFATVLQQFPFLIGAMAVTVIAFLGGRGPAILTVVLSGLYAYYAFIPHKGGFAPASNLAYLGILFIVGLCAIIILLMDGMFAANTALEATRASLKRLNDELEHRIADRTATLLQAQDQLRQTNQNLEGLVEARVGELKVANEEIQRFAYIVSHDLRAPLVNVLGFTGELDAVRSELAALLEEVGAAAPHLLTPNRRAIIETDLPEAIEFIRSSTTKMDRLINAILKLSREGQRRLALEPVDMAALVTAQGQSLSQQLSAKHAELIIEGNLPTLTGDRLAAEQIFGNLIENAVKYLAPDRPGRIVVRGKVDGPTVVYEVADNGRGIAAKDLDAIFDLFRRSGVQDTQGEGIGLAYVRNLARRLGGSVAVRSEQGSGSTFTVSLPKTAVAQPLETAT